MISVVRGQRVSDEKTVRARELRGAMTPAEGRLWGCLRGGQVAGLRFRRQQVLDGFIVDFYCHTARLVIEVDGGIHDDQPAYDAARDAVLASRGLTVLRVTNDDVLTNTRAVLARITALLPPKADNPPTSTTRTAQAPLSSRERRVNWRSQEGRTLGGEVRT